MPIMARMWQVAFTVLGLMAFGVDSSFLRFSCSQLVTERLDPYVVLARILTSSWRAKLKADSLVQPGELPGSHMHQIVGGVRG
jgi:hypothetical protein